LSNDLGFLIIFIILPTILIVSGFWLILIVRSELRLRVSPEASTTSEEAAAESQARLTPPEDEDSPTERLDDLPLVADSDPSESDERMPEPAQPFIVDDEEFWTPEPVAEEEFDPPAEVEPSIRQVESSQPPSGDTANLPEDWEVDLDDADDGVEMGASDDDPDRPQRQPAARMVPSTEHVRRRTGQSPRRSPVVGRSIVRDEDTVESPDGS
jgi:hypothetical protein